MRTYNKLRIKDIYKHGDSVNRPKPEWIILGLGDGAERSHYGDGKYMRARVLKKN